MLEQYPTGIVACVSDSYHILRACSEYWGTELRDLVLSRPAAPGNQLVIRPDSGHVINTLKEVFAILFDKFGKYYTVTSLEDTYVESRDELRTVFENGKLLIETPFEDIRHRARIITLNPSLV